jgi:hypothetical protein
MDELFLSAEILGFSLNLATLAHTVTKFSVRVHVFAVIFVDILVTVVCAAILILLDGLRSLARTLRIFRGFDISGQK